MKINRKKIVEILFKASTLMVLSAIFVNLVALSPSNNTISKANGASLENINMSLLSSKLNSLQSYFTEIKDSSDYKFQSTISNGNLLVGKDGLLTYNFNNPDETPLQINERFITNKEVTPEGSEIVTDKMNYFLGNDTENWKNNITAYGIVDLGELYKNISVQLKPTNGNIEKIITVSPNGNPSDIKIELEGVKNLQLNDQGELEISTSSKTLKMSTPIAYQIINGEKQNIEITYKISENNTYQFQIGEYNQDHPLIIDPILYSTYMGSTDSDEYTSETTTTDRILVIALDGATEYIYVTGYVSPQSDFPYDQLLPSADPSTRGSSDIFVAKLPLDLSEITAASLIGGNGVDIYSTIDADSTGNIYVAFRTTSTNLPTTGSSYQGATGGGEDVGIFKLNAALNTVSAATYVGGTRDETPENIVISNGKVYVAGFTENDASGNDFPVGPTSGGDEVYDHAPGIGLGTKDVFISRLDDTLSNTAGEYFGTFIHTGTISPTIDIISPDADPNNDKIVLAGRTDSGLSIVGATYQTTYGGGINDQFIAIFDSKMSLATGIIASTYIGGSDYTNGSGSVQVYDSVGVGTLTDYRIVYTNDEKDGNDFFSALRTDGNNTRNDYDQISNNGSLNGCNNDDLFVANFKYDLTEADIAVICSDRWDYHPRVILDSSNNIYISATTNSTTFPTTTDAYIKDEPGNYDVALLKFPSDLSSLTEATYIGGGDNQELYGVGMDFDASENLYIAGQTFSDNFPTTPWVVQPTNVTGDGDYFITGITNNLESPCAPLRDNYSASPPSPPTISDMCIGAHLSPGTAYIQYVPDSFEFPQKFSTIVDQNSLSNYNSGTVDTGDEDILTVADLRGNNGAFDVTIQSGIFTNGVDTLPLANFYLVTSIPDQADLNILETSNVLYGTQDTGEGLIYAAGVPAGSQNITSPTGTNNDLSFVSTYTNVGQSFDSSPITIMSAAAADHYLRASKALSYYLKIPANQATGTYSVLLTLDMILS